MYIIKLVKKTLWKGWLTPIIPLILERWVELFYIFIGWLWMFSVLLKWIVYFFMNFRKIKSVKTAKRKKFSCSPFVRECLSIWGTFFSCNSCPFLLGHEALWWGAGWGRSFTSAHWEHTRPVLLALGLTLSSCHLSWAFLISCGRAFEYFK